MVVTTHDDPGLDAVLAHFGVTDPPLGAGGEAIVHPLGDDRVLRIVHAGSPVSGLHERAALLEPFDRSAVAYALPEPLEILTIGDRHVAIETRLPGDPLDVVLAGSEVADRHRLLAAFLDAFEVLPDVLDAHPAGAGVVGDVIGPFVHHAPDTRTWLVERVAQSLARASSDFAAVDPEWLVEGLPTDGPVGLCHLDGAAPNVLARGTDITAVIDFGPTTAIVDRRLDVLAAATYLRIDTLRGAVDPTDHPVMDTWLDERGLLEALPVMNRWLAGYWSWVGDEEPEVDEWCRRTLLEER